MILTNTDYWGGGEDAPANCGGRWHHASPGDVLLAHDDPSARRVAASKGCSLVEVTTRPDGTRLVSGPRGGFVLRGSFPPLPDVEPTPEFACDVAAFGPPVASAAALLAALDEDGLGVRVYDDRPWRSPFQVGRVDGLDLLRAVRTAALVLTDSEDLAAVAWALWVPAAPLAITPSAARRLLGLDAAEFEAERAKTGLVSRAERLAQVLQVA